MPRPERPKGHGVTRADALRIVELAKTHGIDHVKPLLTCPKVTTGNVYEIVEAARRHKIRIGSEDLETVRQAFRFIMDEGLLPESYPHKLSNPDRKLLVGHMRKHGVGPVQRALEGNFHPTIHSGFEQAVVSYKQ